MKKYQLIILLFVISLFVWSPLTVSAMGPPPEEPGYFIEISKYPEATVFVDVLVPIDAKNEYYVPHNQQSEVSENSEIARYNNDGFMRYAFHVKNANVRTTQSDYSENNQKNLLFEFAADLSDGNNRENEKICRDFKEAKLAYCDKDGNILLVSNAFSLKKPFNTYGSIDAEMGTVTVNRHFNFVAIYFCVIVIAILFAVVFITVCMIKFHKETKLKKFNNQGS